MSSTAARSARLRVQTVMLAGLCCACSGTAGTHGTATIAERPHDTSRTTEAIVEHGEVRLAATLDQPPGSGPHPLLLLTHAAGAGERSFAAYRHLAELLPAQGIAVARYDRRGSGLSSGDFTAASFSDLAADAQAVLDWARRRPGVDPDRAGIWGLSQGGWIAPLVAAADPSIAFVIVVSGSGSTPSEQMIFASRFAMREARFGDEAIEAATHLRRTVDDFFRGRIGRVDAARALAEASEQPWFELSFEPPELPECIETTKWYREFDFDPAPSIRQVRAPVLLVLAERDPWIPTDETERVWRTHCPCKLTVARIPNSNHFMAATTDPAHDLDAEPVAPEYSQRLVTWLQEQVD